MLYYVLSYRWHILEFPQSSAFHQCWPSPLSVHFCWCTHFHPTRELITNRKTKRRASRDEGRSIAAFKHCKRTCLQSHNFILGIAVYTKILSHSSLDFLAFLCYVVIRWMSCSQLHWYCSNNPEQLLRHRGVKKVACILPTNWGTS